ncbi:MAG: DivIVA domain-containing protein [Candidatus Wallbacteria bacterium]
MRLSPLDIQQHQFQRKFRGYDEDDVNEFLSKISKEYEVMYAENRNLTEQAERLKAQVKDYVELEKTLKETLVSAQKTSTNLKYNAEKESELLLKESEIKAEKIIEEARAEAKELMREIQELKKTKRVFKIEMKNLLESFAEILRSDEEGEAKRRAQAAAKNE